MRRTRGTTALAFVSIMVALYAQMAALALLLTGSIVSVTGSVEGTAAMVIGALYLGVAVAGYLVGYGLWMRRRWSWAGAVAVFVGLIIANGSLALLTGNLVPVLLPVVGVLVALWYLSLPRTRAELLGTAPREGQASEDQEIGSLEPHEVAEPVR